MPRQDFFVPYLLSSHVKYYLILKTFRHFKTQREKLCNDDVNRVSVLQLTGLGLKSFCSLLELVGLFLRLLLCTFLVWPLLLTGSTV